MTYRKGTQDISTRQRETEIYTKKNRKPKYYNTQKNINSKSGSNDPEALHIVICL